MILKPEPSIFRTQIVLDPIVVLTRMLKLSNTTTYLLITLETNRNDGYRKMSLAPLPSQRYKNFLELGWDKKLVTVEPVMDFDLDILSEWIMDIAPGAVFIGYNSHPNEIQLPEPEKKKTWQLIHFLNDNGVRVLKKEMRDNRVQRRAYRDFVEL